MLSTVWSRIRQSLQHPSKATEASHFLPELHLDALMRLQEQAFLSTGYRSSPASSPLAGQYRSRRQGRGMELSELRNYQPGDDIRLIDWKVTARTQRPHTKVFQEERERPVHLIIDLSHSMLFGSTRSKAEQAVNTAAILGWTHTSQGDRCGGIVFNNHQSRLIKPKSRLKGLLPLFQSCCELGGQLLEKGSFVHSGRINQALRQIERQQNHGSLIIMISDFWSLDLDDTTAINQLSRHHELVAIQVCDPLEWDLPSGICTMTDGSREYRYDGSIPTERAHYQNEFDQRQTLLRQFFHKSRGHFISLATHEKPADKLKQFFAPRTR